MNDPLSQFSAACKAVLSENTGPDGRAQVRQLLEALLQNPDFIDRYCGAQAAPGLHVLYEDPELKFQILAHINEKARVSPPHDHGASWAIYGQAVGYTDMTEFARVDGPAPNQVQLTVERSYRLSPGQAGIYADGAIHSIDYPEKSKFIRVTGTNLDNIARNMFDLKTGTVRQMTPQQAS